MRSRKWLVFALIASVAVNLAMAGFVVGRLGAPWMAPMSLDPSMGLVRVVRELPEERREVLRAELREHFRTLHPRLREMRQAQRRINSALTREPFEPDELSAALAAFRATLLESQQHSQAALVQVVSQMTPEERLLLREAMSRHRRPPGHRDRPDGPPQPPPGG